jgi:DNA topoisomerase VI subunit B
MTEALTRVTAEISRASEFFTVADLQAQTGQPAKRFAAVALKELIDNALDAAESANKAAEITISIRRTHEDLQLSIGDNGDGIAPELVNKIKNFDIRTTDKAIYRSPSRGQQGNALKTILGMPYALGSHEPVVIASCGIRHTIRAWPDPLGNVRADHTTEPVEEEAGTQITLTLPADLAAEYFDYMWWARSYALVNPHALVKILYSEENDPEINQDNIDDPENPEFNQLVKNSNFEDSGSENYQDNSETLKISEIYQPSLEVGKAWRKFMPGDLTAPAWYDVETLKRQVFAHINSGNEITLREYVKSFRGLSANSNAKAVCDRLSDIRRLKDFKSDPDRIADLLKAMKEVAEPPSPAVLGFVGADHIRLCLDKWYGVKDERFWYKRLATVVDGVPYVIEAAAAEVRAGSGAVFHAINFSPSFSDPLAGDWLAAANEVRASGFLGFMEGCYANPYSSRRAVKSNVAIFLHIISPALQFLDRGKTRLQLPKQVEDLVAKALWSVGKTFHAEGKRREKDAVRQHKREQEREREQKTKEDSLVGACYKCLPDAIRATTADGTLPVSSKDLHYYVRPMIQEHTTKTLKYPYFDQTILVGFQKKFGKIKGLYHDPRGYLYEPHTGKKIELGTREVDNYEFPAWLYNKILYIEKKGVAEAFLAAKIPERYDLAIVATEGYATEAIRTLFQYADRQKDYKLFVLHDADPYGYEIARTLKEETDRMPGYHVDVVDLGLKLGEALDDGLQTEDFTRKKRLSSKLVLTDLERKHFEGEYKGNGEYLCKRIEINALTPARRIEYLERKLVEHGATKKAIPPVEVMQTRAKETYRSKVRELIKDAIYKKLKINDMIDEAQQKLGEPDFSDDLAKVTDDLGGNPVEAWDYMVDNVAIRKAVKDVVANV